MRRRWFWALRARGSEPEWHEAIPAVESVARGGGTLVPPIIDAVEKRATLGEIADAMRRAFGEYEQQ